MKYRLSEIAQICGGILIGADLTVEQVITDSRSFFDQKHPLFVAVKGQNHDGHQFIMPMQKRGVCAFLVSSEQPLTPQTGQVLVEDTFAALQLLAAHYRKLYTGIVVGITGSNGKTIVKEWLYQLLAQSFSVSRSPKSWNSQLGVPLSLLRMDLQSDVWIVEAGISMPGEMEKLERLIRPQIGVFTNCLSAHDEHFETRSHKCTEKALLFKHSDRLVADQQEEEVVRHAGDKAFTFGPSGHLQILSTISEPDGTCFEAKWHEQRIRLFVPFTNRASLQNACLAASAALLTGLSGKELEERVALLEPVAMRQEVLQGIGGSVIINDSWHSDPAGLEISLEMTRQQGKGLPLSVILTDVLTGGKDHTRIYQRIDEILARFAPDECIFIGQDSQLLSFPHQSFLSTKEFLEQIDPHSFSGRCILLKGAREFQLERVAGRLEDRTHKTRLEIDLEAAKENLKAYRSKLNQGVKLMAMLKAFAYGTGSGEFARLMAWEGVDYIGVAFTDEGVRLRQAGIELPIMVMDPEKSSFHDLLEHQLEPTVYSLTSLDQFIRFLISQGRSSYPIHLEINTGMNRLGIDLAEVPQVINTLLSQPEVRVRTVFSHLVASDDAEHDAFTRQQIALFSQISEKVTTALGYPLLLHILNTAGLERFPDAQFDMVRTGIGLYGSSPHGMQGVQPVARFLTAVAQVRAVKKGETVGYNRSWMAQKDSLIATLPVGYADGLRRSLSNGKGTIWINGKSHPIVGKICMDLTMVDVTESDVHEEDTAEIFGEHIPLEEFAHQCDTIPYEVLTSISRRVKRVYLQG